MDEQVRVLCTYSTHTIWSDQEAGLRFTKHLRVVSRSGLTFLVCPLDCGWKPEDRLAVAPTRLQNSLQKTELNLGPRSETTSVGNQWRRKTSNGHGVLRSSSAVSLAEGSLVRGMKWANLLN